MNSRIQEAVQIDEEISKLNEARALLVDLDGLAPAKRRGRPPGSKNPPKPSKPAGRKPMSAATRKKLSAIAKARWKKGTGIGVLGKSKKKPSGTVSTKASTKPLAQS